ncbi:ABC transporter permease [Demequina aurantiaca]|uniref:ABC transporter permease n=1 Tax=Demequina aurantiaca TaxID=676200 RepID=UPI00078323BC|nr:ABC transporter permease [Demequina aurantiaca]
MSRIPASKPAPASAANKRPSMAALVWERAVLETKEFSRSREQMLFIFMFPILLLILFASIMGGNDIGGGVDFKQYFLAGMIASGIMNTGFQSLGISLAIDRDDDVLKRIHGSPLPASAFFMGKIVHVLMVSIIQIALLLLVSALLYDIPIPTDPAKWLTFAWVFLLGTAASTVLGIAFSSLARRGRSAPAVLTPIVLSLQFISGVFFVFTQLPSWLQHIAEVFPLKWLAQGMRSVFLPDSFAAQEAAGSWQHPATAIVLAIWFVVGLAVTIKTFRWQRPNDR